MPRSKHYDLIVIGTGAGAGPVARKARKAGWCVAIVDRRRFGGTCALRGCDPKKVIVGVSHLVDAARRLTGKGLTGELRVAWPDLMRFKRTFTEPVPERTEQSLEALGIDTLHGSACFVGRQALEVDGERVEARHVHVASGAEPARLDIPGESHLTTSDDFLELETLPRRLVFVGGGYVSMELAHIAALAGAEVTVLHRGTRPLQRFDSDLVALLVERTRSLGIDLRLETAVEAIEQGNDELVACARHGEHRERLAADLIVHGAGRVPALDDLALDAAGIEQVREGIAVNEYMQSVSNPAVYAAGDAAAGGLPLTPVASWEAHVAAANLLRGNHRRREYPPIPTVVFTDPPLASVGLGEDDARAQGLAFETRHETTGDWFSSRRLAQPCSAFKVLLEQGSERILGAHVLGAGADELINVFTLALGAQMTARQLRQTIFAYPTRASDIAWML